jgi:hypothetical protein
MIYELPDKNVWLRVIFLYSKGEKLRVFLFYQHLLTYLITTLEPTILSWFRGSNVILLYCVCGERNLTRISSTLWG